MPSLKFPGGNIYVWFIGILWLSAKHLKKADAMLQPTLQAYRISPFLCFLWEVLEGNTTLAHCEGPSSVSDTSL